MFRQSPEGAVGTLRIGILERNSPEPKHMLLTIRTTRQPATDLGFLLHKHPEHVHTREFPFGNATVFYPEASEESCTAGFGLKGRPYDAVSDEADSSLASSAARRRRAESGTCVLRLKGGVAFGSPR
jgi:hypothetical protein